MKRSPSSYPARLAAEVRPRLAEAFPGTRFFVSGRSEWQRTGAGVVVRWSHGPSLDAVRSAAGLAPSRLTLRRELDTSALCELVLSLDGALPGDALGAALETVAAAPLSEGFRLSHRASLLARLVEVHLVWFPPKRPLRDGSASGSARLWRVVKIHSLLHGDSDEVLEVLLSLTAERGSALRWDEYVGMSRAMLEA